jgi:hypothetical protein
MTTTSIDQLAGVLRSPVAWEVNDLLDELHPDDLTTCELVAMLAILRGVMARMSDSDTHTPPATLTLLRPKSTRQTRKPVRT